MDAKPYAALMLTEDSRAKLLQRFPPLYSDVQADHLTIAYDVTDASALFIPRSVAVIGYVRDGKGIETLLAEVDGQQFRPDGKPWHITISMDKDQMADPALDPNRPAPQAGEDDTRKPRPYTAAMSNLLILQGLNPDRQDVHIEYLESPVHLDVTPALRRPQTPAPDSDCKQPRPAP